MAKITFIGTAGGRFATIYQRRSTGGIYIAAKGLLMHVDPGPGALVRMWQVKIDPMATNAIFISHAHPDHYTDAEILIEAMTMGGKRKRGVLIGSESIINGIDDFRAISPYHKKLVRKVILAKPNDKFIVEDYEMEATPTLHSDPTTVGFKLHLDNGIISYTADTQYFDDLAKAHMGARILILAVTRPYGMKIPYHLSTEDAIEILNAVKPELAVLTHMGVKFIEDASNQANMVAEKTGVTTISAIDGMRIYMGEKIEIKKD